MRLVATFLTVALAGLILASCGVSSPAGATTSSTVPVGTMPLVAVDQLALTNVSVERASQLLKIASADPWLIAESAGHRVMPVEIIDVGDGKSSAQVWFVDYSAMRTLVLSLSDAAVVTDRRESEVGAANYSAIERAEATAIALGDPEVRARAEGSELVVNNITGASAGECAQGRCLVVFLTPPSGDYADLHIVTVDLAAQRVVSIERGS